MCILLTLLYALWFPSYSHALSMRAAAPIVVAAWMSSSMFILPTAFWLKREKIHLLFPGIPGQMAKIAFKLGFEIALKIAVKRLLSAC